MIADSPLQAVHRVDEAFAQGDLEAVLEFYEEIAVVVTEPGKLACGNGEIRSFFKKAISAGAIARQLRTNIIETDGLALFLSRWTLTKTDEIAVSEGQTFIATSVLRKQPDGSWKALIDNPFGPLVLGPE